MRSTFDPPRPTGPISLSNRPTEQADGKLALRHHEDQPHKKKQDHRQAELTLPEDVYDQASLGVLAVMDFLRQFLRTLEPTSPTMASSPIGTGAINTGINDGGLGTQRPAAANPAAAHAASAYQHTAHVQEPRTSMPVPESGVSPTLLATAEIRQIHTLLDKLHRLDQAGVVAITLEKSTSFLQSLDNAATASLAARGL